MSATQAETADRESHPDGRQGMTTGRAASTRRRWIGPVLTAVVPTAIVVLLILLNHPSRLYTSDSTAQQSIVRTWLDVGHGITSVPRDSWALKVPLYLVVENLSLAPFDKLLLVVLVVNLIMFLMLGWATWRLAAGTTAGARWYEVTIPLVWLVTIGGGLSSNRMTPNYRNVELGLSFLMLALTAAYLGELGRGRSGPKTEQGEPSRSGAGGRIASLGLDRRRIALGLVAAVLIGVLGFDDPYITLLVAGPMIVAALAWYVLRGRDVRVLHVAAVMTASFVATSVLRAIARASGVRFDDKLPSVAISPADLSMHLGLLPSSTGVLLGIGGWDHTTADLAPAELVAQVLVLVVVAVLLAASAVLAWYGWRRKRFVVTFVALHWPLVVGGFLVSWHTQDRSAGRYLVLAIFDLAVVAAILLPRLRMRRRAWSVALIGLLSISASVSLWNGTTTAIERNRQESPILLHQQAVVEAVERAVDEHGAVKGYAPFWSGNITSYLVGDGTTAAEIACRQGQLRSRQWLSDTARLTRPATTVFLIWDPVALAGCSPAVRDAQLGTPIAEYRVTRPPQNAVPGGGTVSVLVYSPDIRSKLPSV